MSNEEEKSPQEASVQKVRLWKKILLSCFVAGLMLVGWVFWYFFTTKAVGTVHVSSSEKSETFDTNEEKRLYRGRNIEFSYRGIYTEQPQSNQSVGPIKESVFLATSGLEGRKIALVLALRGTDDLSADPSFQMRMDLKSQYRSEKVTLAGFSGVLFENNTAPFEMTFFFTHEGYIMSISTTSLFKKDGLKEELSSIVENFHLTTR